MPDPINIPPEVVEKIKTAWWNAPAGDLGRRLTATVKAVIPDLAPSYLVRLRLEQERDKAHDLLREKQAEFDRMENAWHRECERIRRKENSAELIRERDDAREDYRLASDRNLELEKDLREKDEEIATLRVRVETAAVVMNEVVEREACIRLERDEARAKVERLKAELVQIYGELAASGVHDVCNKIKALRENQRRLEAEVERLRKERDLWRGAEQARQNEITQLEAMLPTPEEADAVLNDAVGKYELLMAGRAKLEQIKESSGG